mmetsp:Transcript_46584/g.91985  ORF Transcript_46584/g.91985 Transcript_46584/m.91985 type:complete len:82 (-) Transcript_46584:1129-1374(-)
MVFLIDLERVKDKRFAVKKTNKKGESEFSPHVIHLQTDLRAFVWGDSNGCLSGWLKRVESVCRWEVGSASQEEDGWMHERE